MIQPPTREQKKLLSNPCQLGKMPTWPHLFQKDGSHHHRGGYGASEARPDREGQRLPTKGREKGVRKHTDGRETATQSENSDQKGTAIGANRIIQPQACASPLSPIRFQQTDRTQSQVSSSGKTGCLAQVGVSNLWVPMDSA